jgi:hypothetical protein
VGFPIELRKANKNQLRWSVILGGIVLQKLQGILPGEHGSFNVEKLW